MTKKKGQTSEKKARATKKSLTPEDIAKAGIALYKKKKGKK